VESPIVVVDHPFIPDSKSSCRKIVDEDAVFFVTAMPTFLGARPKVEAAPDFFAVVVRRCSCRSWCAALSLRNWGDCICGRWSDVAVRDLEAAGRAGFPEASRNKGIQQSSKATAMLREKHKWSEEFIIISFAQKNPSHLPE
jgi:hypothetical protein